MTIEIHNAELESILEQHLKNGQFRDVEDLLLQTFRTAQPSAAPPEDEQKRKAQAAAERIREMRQRTKPDPEGWTVKDYINYGRR